MLDQIKQILADYSVFIGLFGAIAIGFLITKFWPKQRSSSDLNTTLSSEEIIGKARTKAYQAIEAADTRAATVIAEADKRATSLVAEADKHAAMVISDADKKAAEMLKTVQVSTADVRRELDAALKQVLSSEGARLQAISDELLNSYRKAAGEAQTSYRKTLEVASNTITTDAREGMLKFQKFLEEEVTRQQNLLSQFMQERRDGAQRDIENYKKNSMRKIDESIYGVLLLVSKEVFGKALDAEAHQELIVQALEQAKKDNFFGV